MEMTLHPLSKTCHASGHAFVEGDRVICHLVREPGGEIGRRDVLVAEDAAFTKPGPVLCSWTVSYKPRHGEDNPGRALKLTAENLFVTLADPAAEPNPVNTPMLQFLALLLERKKLLRPRGLTSDGERQVFEHAKTHQLYEIPVGELDEAFFVNIQGQLGLLVGSPKAAAKPEPAANSA
ncbi:MAG: hypothetical protein JWM35_351 [Verrucomicrobia bacterium]|nr:hypothetical protein [Verrucomicrobiota bacterium]